MPDDIQLEAFHHLPQHMEIPVYLDDNPEMLVGMMVINPAYAPDFDAGNPIKTHMKPCPVHGRHTDRYSLPGTNKKGVRIDITLTPTRG